MCQLNREVFVYGYIKMLIFIQKKTFIAKGTFLLKTVPLFGILFCFYYNELHYILKISMYKYLDDVCISKFC